MIVEVIGIGYPNKGAELMLCAVADQVLHNWGDDVIVATRPMQGGDLGYRALTSCSCHQRATLIWKGIDLGTPLGNLAPKKLLRTYGVIAEKEIDVVLDASGLRYTDKWGLKPVQNAVREYARVKKRGGKIILLPQAFGPFEDPMVQEGMKRLHALVDRIYARDAVSYQHLTSLLGQSEKIHSATDFTGLVEGIIPTDAEKFRGKIAVIPNQRMMDKTSKEVATRYFEMLVAFVRQCQTSGKEVFVINHEGRSDEPICKQLCSAFEPVLPYTGIRSAKEVKGLISLSSGVMTSRFHGLVSAFMQGVPALTTSWSHKYEELLNLFEASDCLLDSSDQQTTWKNVTGRWLNEAFNPNASMQKNYKVIAEGQKESIGQMWKEIERILE